LKNRATSDSIQQGFCRWLQATGLGIKPDITKRPQADWRFPERTGLCGDPVRQQFNPLPGLLQVSVWIGQRAFVSCSSHCADDPSVILPDQSKECPEHGGIQTGSNVSYGAADKRTDPACGVVAGGLRVFFSLILKKTLIISFLLKNLENKQILPEARIKY